MNSDLPMPIVEPTSEDMPDKKIKKMREDLEQPDDPSTSLMLKQKIEDMEANRELRYKYAFKAYKIVKKSIWGWTMLLAIYGLMKLLTRQENNGHGFEIFSDTVLIAITSATTLNIFAAFLSLVKGLFPSLKNDKEK